MAENQKIIQEIGLDPTNTNEELARIDAAEKKLAASIEQAGRASTKAAAQSAARESKLSRLRHRLEALVRAQMAYQEQIEKGAVADRADAEAQARRTQQIDRVSRALAREAEVRQTANASIHSYRHSLRGVEEDSKRAGEKTSHLGNILYGLQGRFLGLVTYIAGVGGVLSVLRTLRQEMDQDAQSAQKFSDSYKDLQFLNKNFQPAQRKFLLKQSVIGARDPSEAGRAYLQLESFFPHKSQSQLESLFARIIQTGRTTSAPLSSLTQAFQGLYKETGNPLQAQNLLYETIKQAGVSDPGTLSTIMGTVLSTAGEIGKLNAGQSAGVLAAATGLDTRHPAEQATSLHQLILQLMTNISPKGAKIMDRLHIDRSNFLSAVVGIERAYQSGKITPAQLETIEGSSAITTGSQLVRPEKLRDFLAKVHDVEHAGYSPVSLTDQAFKTQLKEDPLLRNTFAKEQATTKTTVQQIGDTRAQKYAALNAIYDNVLREHGYNAASRQLREWVFQQQEYFESPESLLKARVADDGGALNRVDREVQRLYARGQAGLPIYGSGNAGGAAMVHHDHRTTIHTQYNNTDHPSTAGLHRGEHGQ